MSDTDKATAPRQPPWPAPLVAPLPAGRFAKNEEWAWARIANGMDADMAEYPGDEADPNGEHYLAAEAENYQEEPPDPTKLETFKPQHKLSELFLRTILFHEPWASAPERTSVRVFNALIGDAVDWSARETKGALWFLRCRFERDVTWRWLHVRGLLSLESSVLASAVDADGLQVDGDLFCRNGFVAEQDIYFLGAHFEGSAEFDRASFKGVLYADRLQVDGGLFCRDGFVAAQDIRLLGAHIGGNAEFTGATLKGWLIADVLQVDGDLYLRGMKRLCATNLFGAKVGGDLQLRRSQIDGKIDLTGATITGELHLDKGWDEEGKTDTLPNWGQGARLILRNASAASVAGRLDAFRRKRENKSPKHSDFVDMDLTGFRYQRLGGLEAAHKDALAAAEAAHLVTWLEAGRGDGAFNPDPYRQLARALETSGHTNKARRILRAMAAHEHSAAKGRHKIPFFFSWLFIDYGYSNLRALYWFLGLVFFFTALGLAMEGLCGFGFGVFGFAEVFRWLGFSFGNAVPLIDFDKAHETFLAARFGDADDPASVPVAIAWAFYLEKVLGFIILTYLAAGLSGLAHRRVEND